MQEILDAKKELLEPGRDRFDRPPTFEVEMSRKCILAIRSWDRARDRQIDMEQFVENGEFDPAKADMKYFEGLWSCILDVERNITDLTNTIFTFEQITNDYAMREVQSLKMVCSRQMMDSVIYQSKQTRAGYEQKLPQLYKKYIAIMLARSEINNGG